MPCTRCFSGFAACVGDAAGTWGSIVLSVCVCVRVFFLGLVFFFLFFFLSVTREFRRWSSLYLFVIFRGLFVVLPVFFVVEVWLRRQVCHVCVCIVPC